MAAAPAARGSGAALAPQAQKPQAEPARGAEGARGGWARDWDADPDPLGGKALPLMMEVYGWLSWATSGTTRWLRNWPFNAVLLIGRPRGPRKGPLGRDLGGVARPGADVASFPEGGGGAPPEEPANAAVPAPILAAWQVIAARGGYGPRWQAQRGAF